MNQPHILVVGGGSIGQRHIKNLMSQGVAVGVVERDQDRWMKLFTEISSEMAVTRYIDDALNRFLHYDGAIIAVPTHLHAECALPLLKLGIPVLIEKPLAHTVAAAKLLRPYASQIRVGYSMRFHPAIQAIKEHLPEIGRIIYAHAEVGQYLPQWHPTEDYRKWYMSKKEQGGGAILDLSHELDYLQWLVGSVHKAAAFVGHVDKTLEITSDDLADIRGTLDPSSGENNGSPVVRFSCHMDLIDRSYNRRVRILGEKGTIQWVHGEKLEIWSKGKYEEMYGDLDLNIQFVSEAQAFLAWCAGESNGEMATFDEGFHTLEVVEDLRQYGNYR